MKPFKVSVCMITYNHEKYIAQAIEGFLIQQCDFQAELIIGEDCSTDNTRAICIAYQNKYPDKIKLRLPEKNLGGMANFIQNIENASNGYQYVAMCEGDDYWTDPHKLQKQADYLEAHPDCGLVYTNVRMFDDAKNEFLPDTLSEAVPDDRAVAELIRKKYIHFPSMMVRSDLLREIMVVLKPELPGKIIADTRLILEFAQRAKIGFLPEQTTVYRIVEGSASHPKSVEKFIFASKDSYDCRKDFVLRHRLNPKLLALPVCNFNRGLINLAAVQPNYGKAMKLIRAIKISDLRHYCDWKTFRQKTDIKILAKLVLSVFGINAIKAAIK